MRGLVEVIGLQFTEGAQLIDGQLDTRPFGDVRRFIEEYLPLGGKGYGLALQRFAGQFA
ncbi:hypothetical protein D3C81_2295260 [compost metagenome]